mgnify:CR=1 FL=1
MRIGSARVRRIKVSGIQIPQIPWLGYSLMILGGLLLTIPLWQFMRKLGRLIKEAKEKHIEPFTLGIPEGTPCIEDIGEFVDNAAEEGQEEEPKSDESRFNIEELWEKVASHLSSASATGIKTQPIAIDVRVGQLFDCLSEAGLGIYEISEFPVNNRFVPLSELLRIWEKERMG